MISFRGKKGLVSIKILRNNQVLADQCVVADQLWERIQGLLGTRELREGCGMWLKPANSVHTWFMKYAIDVIFLDRHNSVVGFVSCVSPWRLILPRWKAASVLELPAGRAVTCDLNKGDRLCIDSRSSLEKLKATERFNSNET